MPELPENTLDCEELLQLGLNEALAGRPAWALAYYKQALEREPENAHAHYLLGALHAELGLVARGIAEMQHAVELQPDLLAAHFQIGLLELDAGALDAAKEAWKPLAMLPQDHPLACFQSGLVAVEEDRLADGIAALEAGVVAAGRNDRLCAMMQRVADSARWALTEAARANTGTADPRAPEPAAVRNLLARYDRSPEPGEGGEEG